MSTQRPLIVGPDAGPEHPYPYTMEGDVIKGFGRGSKELGIPTANLPVDPSFTPWISSIPSGIYFGYASLRLPRGHPQLGDDNNDDGSRVRFEMVMSIGYNPFYKNTVRSAEVHVLHRFGADFYGAHMRLLIVGFIREERDYKSLEALVEDIECDCRVARASLARDRWRAEAITVEREDAHGGRENGAEWLVRKL